MPEPRMPGTGRNELAFQTHVINGYKRAGGYARKWASAWVGGVPDLVCSMPVYSSHFVEVKHLPEWKGQRLKNPMTVQQRDEAKKLVEAGATVYLGVVWGSTQALWTQLSYLSPLSSHISSEDILCSVPYVRGSGYDIKELLRGCS